MANVFKIHDQSFMPDILPRERWYKSDVWTKDGPDTSITFYTDIAALESPYPRPVNDTYRVAMLLEPREISSTFYHLVEDEPDRFDLACSHDRDFVEAKYESRAWYPYGTSWIDPVDRVQTEKTKDFSLIISKKSSTTGHKLRHSLASYVANRGIDLCGSAYGLAARKAEMLLPYRFSIVIENSRVRGFFTEKLIDCLLTWTIPIYWGCPDVHQYFDARGMIVADSFDGIIESIARIQQRGIASTYSAMLPFAHKNNDLAQKYLNPDRWITENILAKRGWFMDDVLPR